MTAVVLLGPPGAGKGTVAEALAKKGYTHVSTGQLLREQIQLGTPLGHIASQFLDAGKFVPDEVVVGLIRKLLSSASPGQKFLFDGFPRTLVQAEQLDALLQSLDGKLTSVVLLECPDEMIVDRLGGRRTCTECGNIYHVVHNPPATEGLCDRDGGKLQLRPDDAAETVQGRLDIYAQQTAPLIGYYRDKGLLFPIDAAQDIDAVRNAVFEKLG